MSGIFISYRRDDTRGTAGRLYDDLTDRFGSDRVFRDLDAIEPGADYSERIDGFIRSCDVLVAVIGRGWLDARDPEGRRRLDDPEDFVRREIVTALEADKMVIPVLVEDAPMPAASAMPAPLAPLANRNALPLSDARWRYDVGVLTRRLEKVLTGEGKPAPTTTETAARPDAGGPETDRRQAWTVRLRRWRWQLVVVLAVLLLAGTVLAVRSGQEPGVGQGPARLEDPRGLAVDASGNLYVADYAQNRVVKVAPDGRVTTVAGNRQAESTGDGGPATSASLAGPGALAVDATGSLYIAEGQGIRKVAPDGPISSVRIVAPGVEQVSASAIAVALDGSILVATTREVLRIGPDGRLSPVAGSSATGFGGDNGPATSAKLDFPSGLTVAGDGSIYIADTNNNRVRKVGIDGTMVTVAGTGSSSTSGRDGDLAVETAVPAPSGIVADRDGTLYVSSYNQNQVFRITSDGRIFRIAGVPDGTSGFSGDGGPALSARMNSLAGLARDAAGNLYVSDSGNKRVRKITPAGVITTIA